MNHPRRITVAEAATLTRRSPKTIYGWIRDEALCLSVWDAEDGTTRLDFFQVMEAAERMKQRRFNKK